MSRIHVINHLDDLYDDARRIAVESRKDMAAVVREGIKVGSMVARDNARQSAGKHGKHYPRSITSSMNRGAGLFGNTFSGEYGPEMGKPQGGMSFEFGSRNQKPHLDLARSADLIAPAFQGEVRRLPERWFW